MKFNRIVNILYTATRNYCFLKIARKFLKNYNEYKHNIDLYNTNYLSSVDKNDIVSFVNAKIILSIIKVRGGFSDGPFYYAIFRLMNLLEKYIRKLLPKVLLERLLIWNNLKKDYPKLETLEDILLACLSVTIISIVLHRNNSPKLKIDLGNTLTERIRAFEEFLLTEGIDDKVCDNQATMLYSILSDSRMDSSIRLTLLKL